jgi:glycosyltransferase involved in cell wall biosynthesis
MNKLPLTIAYVTVNDPRDRRSWSGTDHYLLHALERRVARVEVIGPLRPQPELFLCRAFNQMMLRTTGKRYNYRDSVVMARAYARMIGPRLRDADLIVAPAGLATTALLRTKVPIIHVNDRCIAGAIGYHRILSDLADFSLRESLALERRTLVNAALTVYSSHWAADAARAAMPEAAGKVRVIPFGANLEEAPPPPAPRAFPPERLKLLMLGVNWAEKGGPIAYDTLLDLKRRGQRAQLVVCGCDPPPGCADPDLVREGFLDKNIPAERARLEEHLRTADVLLLPTRFEAYGIVFCESAAYGIPVLATRTGGIPTIVQEGITGHLLDPTAGGAAYTDRVMELVRHPDRWQAMRQAARTRYESTLNWEAFVERLLREAHEAGLISSAR